MGTVTAPLSGRRSRAAALFVLAVVLLPASALAQAWSRIGPEPFDATVYALCEFRGDVIATGNFRDIGTQRVNHIARWDGEAWHPLGAGLGWDDPAFDPYQVWGTSMVVLDDQLYVGGHFRTAGGIPAHFVARWDGEAWHPVGSGFDNRVYDLEVYRGQLVACGSFVWAGDRKVLRVARLSSGTWRVMEAGLGYPVHTLHAHGDFLYAGGMFGTTGTGRPADRIAEWDGLVWRALADRFEAFDNRGVPVTSIVLDFASFQGDLIIAGLFDAIDGQPYHSLARYDGTAIRPLGAAGETPNVLHDRVFSLAVHGDELIVGGLGDDPTPTWLRQITRWDGTRFRELDGGVDHYVQALLSTDDGLVVGGSFLSAGGDRMRSIALWSGGAPVGAPALLGGPTVRVAEQGTGVRLNIGLDRSAPLLVDVFDLRGRHVERVFRGRGEVGTTIVDWDGRDASGSAVARGRYLLRVAAGPSEVSVPWTVLR